LQSGLAGVSIDEERHLTEVVQLVPESYYRENGRPDLIGDPARLNEPRSAIIFASQARRLDVTIGDVLTMRSQTFRGQTNTVDVTIVAVARDIGLISNFAIFVPKETILDLYQLSPRTTGAVMVYLKDIHQAERVLGHLTDVLQREGFEVMDHMAQPFFAKFDIVAGEDWTGQKLDITTWEDEIAFLTWLLTALDTITFFLIAILAVIIAIGMMNTMWIAVRERTKELGTIRAIGMTRRGVLTLFMLEATILGLVASTTGAVTGALIATAVNAARIPVPVEAVQAILLSDTLQLATRPQHLLLAIFALTLWTGLSALWPSIRAARLQPVEAIHET
jgi:putative ABC transport system permease protein